MSRASVPPLFPPLRFATVEKGLHRGAFPTLRNFRFLRRLRLRTVISLTPNGPTTDLEEWCEAEEAQMIHHQTTIIPSEPLSLSPAIVASVLSVLIDPTYHPVYVHCLDGIQATGIVVMCLRKLQNWALPSIFAEHIRFLQGNPIPEVLERFVAVEFGKGAGIVAGGGPGGTGIGSGVSSGSGISSGIGPTAGADSGADDLAVVVGEHVPSWLWGGLRSPVLQTNVSQTGTQQTVDSSLSSGLGRSHPTVRLRHNPPLFEPSVQAIHLGDSVFGKLGVGGDVATLSVTSEKITAVTRSGMMIGDGLKIGRPNSRVVGSTNESTGRGSREGSEDGASDNGDRLDDNDHHVPGDHSQQFIGDFSKPITDQDTFLSSANLQGSHSRERSNQMGLSRSLRALDLEGLEKNLSDRKISAHWDLVNSPW